MVWLYYFAVYFEIKYLSEKQDLQVLFQFSNEKTNPIMCSFIFFFLKTAREFNNALQFFYFVEPHFS